MMKYPLRLLATNAHMMKQVVEVITLGQCEVIYQKNGEDGRMAKE